MYHFDISMHGLPDGISPGPEMELRTKLRSTLEVTSAAMGTALGVSFDDAYAAIEQLDRLFIEPDGSFFWTSPSGPAGWQLDGVLYDGGGRLNYVDLHGRCPQEEFDQLLRTLGWPTGNLMFQLSREAVYLDENTFRDYASDTHRQL